MPIETQQRITGGVRKALLERPSRLTHGYTTKNAFWIDDLGNIIQYDRIVSSPYSSDAIMVHSHLPENFWQVAELYEQTFNAGDLYAVKWQIQHGYGNKAVVLTSLASYDYIEIPPRAQGPFLKLGMTRLSELVEARYGSYEDDRIKLRTFADAYGLIYKEKQPWTVPPEVLKERMPK